MNSPTLLRPAELADSEAIAAIYNESIAIGDASMDELPRSIEEQRGRFTGLAKREGLWVLEAEGRVLGWSALQLYSDREGYRFTGESTVYLRRDRVRCGFGEQLMRKLFDAAVAWDYHHLVAKVLADNAGSLAFHQRLGFETVGRQREVGFRDGRWVDVCILECLLLPAHPGDATSV